MSRNSNSPVNDLLAVAVFERVRHLSDVLGRSWFVEPGAGISFWLFRIAFQERLAQRPKTILDKSLMIGNI